MVPADELRKLLERIAQEPEGSHRWEGRASGCGARAVFAVTWWADHLGRTHVRICGYSFVGDPTLQELALPPLAKIQPQRTLLRYREGREELLVLCPCSVGGPPERLAWMGDRCGVCHDRAGTGEEPPRGFAAFEASERQFAGRDLLVCPRSLAPDLLLLPGLVQQLLAVLGEGEVRHRAERTARVPQQ